MVEWDILEDLKNWVRSLKEKKSYSDRTLDAYWSDVHTCLKFMAERVENSLTRINLRERTHQDFRAWLQYRKEKGYGVRSTVRAFSIMKQFCKFLVSQGILNTNPLVKLKAPSVTPKDTTHKQWILLRDQILKKITSEIGLTIIEALELNQNDIVISPPMITLTDRRHRHLQHKRFAPLTEDFLAQIQLYLSLIPFEQTEDAPLFLNVRGKRLSPILAKQSLNPSVKKLSA